MTRERVGGLVVDPTNPFIAYQARVAELAMKHRLPALSEQRDFVAAGGLMCYGPSVFDVSPRMAHHMKILKGAKPGGFPIEPPIKFDLETLGLTIPPSVLVRADQVIQ